jgi:hypothetical protein
MPFDCRTLLELPLHIQDGALFLPQRLNLSAPAAWDLCESFIQHASATEGVLTILWHDRSHAAERFWGDFYIRLVQRLKVLNVWFATASQVVRWFRWRRNVIFRRDDGECADTWVEALGDRDSREPLMTVRIHVPGNSAQPAHETATSSSECVDIPWKGGRRLNVDQLARDLSRANSTERYTWRTHASNCRRAGNAGPDVA